jgi:2-polyprenyl-3-methyl-5-hydroxy-6-metoxy-1,4-benzoquinol methylase
MKFIDRVLRNWRVKMCIPYVRANDKILDIGCLDGYLFKKLESKTIQESIGLDPLLTEVVKHKTYTLIPGNFPHSLTESNHFNCITMLAVLEHIPREQQKQLNNHFKRILEPFGRIIITVPSPFIDHILWIFSKLHIIDGMSIEEHYGFKVEEVPDLFDSKQFKLIKHKKFQLGFNNLFVFEKNSNIK